MSLAGFPADDLGLSAVSLLCPRSMVLGCLRQPTLQCSQRFFTELCTFMPLVCCVMACTEGARAVRGRESIVERHRNWAVWTAGLAVMARAAVRERAPKERIRVCVAIVRVSAVWCRRCSRFS